MTPDTGQQIYPTMVSVGHGQARAARAGSLRIHRDLRSIEARSRACSNRGRKGGFKLSSYLINHLRIPGGVPNEEGLSYLEQVQSTVKAYGGRWLA